MTGMLVERAKGQAVERVKAVARRIATEAPHLADLPAADLERIDYPAERQRFLQRASRTDSPRT